MTKSRYKNILLGAIEKAAGDIKVTDHFIHQSKNLLEIFQDSSLSNKIDRNIRFKTIERCLLPFLDSSKEEFLSEFFIEFYQKIIDIFNKGPFTDPVEKLLHLKEMTAAFNIFEILFRRISIDKLKKEVHKRLIPSTTAENEITKKLILISHSTKKC